MQTYKDRVDASVIAKSLGVSLFCVGLIRTEVAMPTGQVSKRVTRKASVHKKIMTNFIKAGLYNQYQGSR